MHLNKIVTNFRFPTYKHRNNALQKQISGGELKIARDMSSLRKSRDAVYVMDL